MTFERSKDWKLIRDIITHPKIYPWVTDDYAPLPKDYEPPQIDAIWYVVARDGSEVLGLWMLVPENAICWKIHTCLLPSAWGARAATAAKQLAVWIWDKTVCQRLNTDVPKVNRLALRFAERAGMEQFGVNPKSFMKHGKLQDLIMLGISRPGAV